MKGFSRSNLLYMRAFAEAWPDEAIVQQVVGRIPWGHNVRLLDRLSTPDERVWYARQAIEYGWSRNVLEIHIESRLHERQGQAVTNFQRVLPAPQSDLAAQLLKDPYNFDFLSLGKEAEEREIEAVVDDLLRHPDDATSIGLLLCKSKNQVVVEYSLRNLSTPMGISTYQLTGSLPEEIRTALPTIEELEQELISVEE